MSDRQVRTEGFVDRAAAAELVCRSERTIYRWVALGELTPVMGHFRASDVLEVDRLMRTRKGRPGMKRGARLADGLDVRPGGEDQRDAPLHVSPEAAEDVVDALRDLMFVLEDVEAGTVELPQHYAAALADAKIVLGRLAELVPEAAEVLDLAA
jgi:hypothetical protein